MIICKSCKHKCLGDKYYECPKCKVYGTLRSEVFEIQKEEECQENGSLMTS